MEKNKIFWMQPIDTKLGHWQDQILKKTGSNTFCVLPWIHLATRPNGDMRLCCSANASGAGLDHEVGLVKNEAGHPANFGRESPMIAWNNEYMRSVRTTMLRGNIPASCKKCFDEESKGIVSKRVWETSLWSGEGINLDKLVEETSKNGTVPEKLIYLDLRLGHTCNLKCVMCSPHDSSRWAADHKKIFPLFQQETIKSQMQWDQSKFNNSWHQNPNFWQEIYEQIPNLRQVYFAGGEPLIIKEHNEFLEEIVRQGYADKISIRYNTNGLSLSKDILDLWSKFQQVKVGFSIDDIEDRNYFIRFPADWNVIESNLSLLDATPDNIQINIATAVQILNIKTLPELAKWKINQRFKKINFGISSDNTELGGGIINMHLLYIPTFLNIRILPDNDKIEVMEKFSELKSWLWSNYRKDNDFWNINPYGWKRWEAILNFMNSEDQSHLLPAFKEYIQTLDSERNTNFRRTFPHLSHLL